MSSFKLKPLLGISEGYFAGNDGYIYSTKWYKIPKRLKYCKGSKGNRYFQVNLDGKTRLAHRLIYEAFHGKIPKGKVISHKDGNMYNNVITNLICETQKENLNRKFEHGTDDRGIKNSRAKINKEQLAIIRKLLEEGDMTHESIGNLVGVSRVFITKIKNGYRYKD